MKKKINTTEQEGTAVENKARKSERTPLGVRIAKYVTALAVVLVLFWFGCTCEVREGQCAVILRFGAVREEITDAGLYLKLPWPFETAVTYDERVQYLESNQLETTTKDQRNIIIQSWVAWSISDPVLYHNSVGAQGTTESYIKDQVFDATNGTMGTYNLSNLVSLDKEQIKIDTIQQEIFLRVQENCRQYGIEVKDVSIMRLSLPDTNLEAVFEQMRATRQKEIDAIIENAYLEATKITSGADVEAEIIRKEGTEQAAAILAQTEKEVAAIYNEAYAANIDLYKFLKNLDTIVASVNSSTILVVDINEYPFNILLEYSDFMTEDGEETVISDLSYILSVLPDDDRQALVDSIYDLINAASNGANG